MRVSSLVFFVMAGFFFIVGLVYWYTSHDPTGTTALAFSLGLAFLIGYYLAFTWRRLPPQPDDLDDGDVADGAGELGFFSPHSPWPFFMGLGAAVTLLGLVFGWWLFFIGMGVFGGASLGLLFEYYVGEGPGPVPPDVTRS